jgi:transcriptional regulator with XRE-family HTH domain
MAQSARSLQHRLGERIQTLRLDRALTQDALAKRCRISQKYLSELERGEKAASLETLVALAHRGFQIRLAALVFGVDDDVTPDLKRVDELLAGRPEDVQGNILKAVDLLLNTGDASKR